MKSSEVLQVTWNPAQQFGEHTLVQFEQICAPRVSQLLQKEFLCVELPQHEDSLVLWEEKSKWDPRGTEGKQQIQMRSLCAI